MLFYLFVVCCSFLKLCFDVEFLGFLVLFVDLVVIVLTGVLASRCGINLGSVFYFRCSGSNMPCVYLACGAGVYVRGFVELEATSDSSIYDVLRFGICSMLVLVVPLRRRDIACLMVGWTGFDLFGFWRFR